MTECSKIHISGEQVSSPSGFIFLLVCAMRLLHGRPFYSQGVLGAQAMNLLSHRARNQGRARRAAKKGAVSGPLFQFVLHSPVLAILRDKQREQMLGQRAGTLFASDREPVLPSIGLCEHPGVEVIAVMMLRKADRPVRFRHRHSRIRSTNQDYRGAVRHILSQEADRVRGQLGFRGVDCRFHRLAIRCGSKPRERMKPYEPDGQRCAIRRPRTGKHDENRPALRR